MSQIVRGLFQLKVRSHLYFKKGKDIVKTTWTENETFPLRNCSTTVFIICESENLAISLFYGVRCEKVQWFIHINEYFLYVTFECLYTLCLMNRNTHKSSPMFCFWIIFQRSGASFGKGTIQRTSPVFLPTSFMNICYKCNFITLNTY